MNGKTERLRRRGEGWKERIADGRMFNMNEQEKVEG